MAGRTKKKYLDIELVKSVAQKAGCRSRQEYFKWFDQNKPNNIPKHPDRAYDKWVSWNDFLNTTNTFTPNTKTYVNYWDGVKIAQDIARKNKLTTSDQWLRYGRNNKLPDEIPLRPDQYYEEWKGKGWKTWLGTDIQSRIEIAKQQVPVFAIMTTKLDPQNIITTLQVSNVDDLKEFITGSEQQYKVAKLYIWEEDKRGYLEKLFTAFAFNRGSNQWLVPNYHSLIFELDNLLEWYRP